MDRRQFWHFSAAGLAAGMGLLASGQEPPKNLSELQVQSNSTLWDQDRWEPKVITLSPADITHLIGYNGRLAGGLRLSEGDIEPRRVPYGFASKEATLSWEVQVPEEGEHEVAVLYHPGQEENVGSRFELTCGNRSLTTVVRAPTDVQWKGGTRFSACVSAGLVNGKAVLEKG